jgi:hypothetical protein
MYKINFYIGSKAMVEVKVSFESLSAAAAFFRAYDVEKSTTRGDESNAGGLQISLSDSPGIEGSGYLAETPAAPAEKRSRTKKEKAPAAATVDAQPVAPAPAPEAGDQSAKLGGDAAKVTLDQVREALSKFVAANGFAAGTALVQSFKKDDGTPARRLTELRGDDYAAFVNAAKVAA